MLAPLPRDGYRGAMDITYLGHAGFAIGQEGHLLVLDPWLSPSGAYGQGWFQWPPNHFMREKFIARIKSLPPGSVTFYISHEHRDHFDPETLEAILAATPGSSPLFVVPAFEEKSFETLMRDIAARHGARVQLLGDKESAQAGPFGLTMYVDDMGLNHDSALFVETKDGTFFSQNDCKIYDRLPGIKAAHPRVDYYAAQFSGANWYPSTFTMPEEQKQSIAHGKKVQKFKNVRDAIALLAPRCYVANAGPVVFLDPREDYINRGVYNFPFANELFDYLKRSLPEGATRLAAPKPGETQEQWTDEAVLPDEKTIAEYRARCFTGRPGLRCTLEELVAHLEEKNRRIAGFRANLAGEAPIVFSAFGANIAVTLGERVEKIDALPERYLLLDAPEWWLAAMVGGWSGQDLCLTMAPRLARVGHDYSTAQNIFLFSNLGDVATNFRQTFTIRQERIRKEEGGVVYEIDRYCPHQGGDLLHCELKRGRIRCARHSIVFDLAQGGAAVNAEGLSINAVVVEKVAVPAE